MVKAVSILGITAQQKLAKIVDVNTSTYKLLRFEPLGGHS